MCVSRKWALFVRRDDKTGLRGNWGRKRKVRGEKTDKGTNDYGISFIQEEACGGKLSSPRKQTACHCLQLSIYGAKERGGRGLNFPLGGLLLGIAKVLGV